jgi:hypothetical protein
MIILFHSSYSLAFYVLVLFIQMKINGWRMEEKERERERVRE